MEDSPDDAPESRTLDGVGTTMNDLGDSMEGWSDDLRSLNDAVQDP